MTALRVYAWWIAILTAVAGGLPILLGVLAVSRGFTGPLVVGIVIAGVVWPIGLLVLGSTRALERATERLEALEGRFGNE